MTYAKHDMMRATRLTGWLSGAGHLPAGGPPVILTGGRSNLVWRVGTGPDALVCKLTRPGRATPLFPNDGAAEACVLRALKGCAIAPELSAAADTPDGLCLVYRYLPGPAWSGDPAPVAHVLRRMHGLGLGLGLGPQAGAALRRVSSDPESLRGQGHRLLAGAGAVAVSLRDLVTPAARGPEGPETVLHGDPVPGNIVMTGTGAGTEARLIDWQCPARGEAAHDLAMFLSPAMQVVNGRPPLDGPATAAFLAAYGDARTTARLHSLRPLLSWRMACYCAWKSARGDRAYARGLEAELALLATLREG